MVYVSSAIAQHSASVCCPRSCINTHRNRPSLDGFLELWASFDVSNSGNSEGICAILACAYYSLIGILVIWTNSVLYYVFITISWEASSAPSIAIGRWAINQLLLWKSSESTISYFTQSLESPCNSKSPTGTALALVFDRRNSPLLHPVNINIWICIEIWNL